MRPPSEQIGETVRVQKRFVSELFDEHREGSRDTEGVTRDTFGAGEQFGYRVIAACAQAMGLEQSWDHGANLYMILPGPGSRRTAGHVHQSFPVR
jgi:N-carbamoyl-L-amino-acid hydrolase